MTWSVWIDQVDLATLGLYVEAIPGWISGPGRQYQTVAIPGRMGALLAAEPDIGPRRLSLQGTIVATAIATRQSYENQILGLAYRGLVTITLDDDVNPPLRIDGVCEQVQIEPRVHPMNAWVSKASLQFLCPDPSFYALTADLVAFGATPVPIPLGNAISGGVIRIAAPKWSANVTDPTITYYSAGRAAVQSLGFTGITLSAETDYLEIDLDRATVVEVASGISTNRIAALASGDFFALDPMDGDYVNSAFPFLAVTATAGTPSAVVAYTRRWL